MKKVRTIDKAIAPSFSSAQRMKIKRGIMPFLLRNLKNHKRSEEDATQLLGSSLQIKLTVYEKSIF